MAWPQPRSIGELVNLRAQLRRDEPVNDRELRVRDRAIGRELTHLRRRPVRQVLAWLRRVQTEDHDSPGSRADTALAVAGLLIVAVAFVLGWASAMAIFHYNGTHPVNVVRVLAFYVGLQLVLVLLTVLASLPGDRLGFQRALRLLSPGRLITLLIRILPQRYRESFDLALGSGQAHRALYGRLEKWVVLAVAQGFAVFFNVGAVLGVLQLIIFSDLAFGWSTTLTVSPEQFTQLIHALALPWSWLLADARPDAAMIEATRYFRAQEHIAQDTESLQQLGGWWPFLLAAMVTYGLLPRVVLLVVGKWRAWAALRDAVLHAPGVPRLLDRLNAEIVESRAADPETYQGDDRPPAAHHTPGPVQPAAVIAWAGFSTEAVCALTGGGDPNLVLRAGGGSLDDDRRAAEAAAELSTHRPHGTVLVVVKSWEPPVLDLTDFLTDLRRALGPHRPISVMPAALRDGRPAPPRADDLRQYRGALAKLGDPHLTVDAPEPEAEA